MQKVSDAYKKSMKQTLRERGYIMLSFGLINQEAQAKARIQDGDFTKFSNTSNIFGERTDSTTYATLEENFTRVDGSMFFLPRSDKAIGGFYDTGISSSNLISDGAVSVTINLNIIPTDFKGITINFGENYPVDFDIESDRGQCVEFRGNDQQMFTTEEVFESTSALTLTFYRMKNPQSRLRIYSIRFGYGLVYYNDSVMGSSLESYVSPIGADIPQIDFTVTLKNYDKYFNVDNPRSAINFLETGQEMDVYYGYQLPDGGEIEWIKGNHLICSEWESDDYTATIRCQDVFRSTDTEYHKGMYAPAGRNYFDLAVEIMTEAGLTNYYIDPRLKKLYTKNPMPRVKHKEALQIIANACRCVLSQSRDGAVQIKSNFNPEAAVSSNGEAPYSKVSNILNGEPKSEYATLATGYTVVDGGMFFLPRNEGDMNLNTGFVSKEQSDAEGKFTTNPMLIVTQEAICMYHGVRLEFGNVLPSGIIMRSYNTGELVEEYVVTETIEQDMVILHEFDDLDKMEIEFTGTAEPYNRIVVHHFSFGDVANFTITKKDMTSSPKAIKQELVKEVIVPCYTYQQSNHLESLVYENVEVTEGQIVTYYVQDPSYGYYALLDEQEGMADVLEWGNYYVTVQYKVSGAYTLEVRGYRYKIAEQYVVRTLNLRGKTVKWENPLISDIAMANDLADWISDYYTAGIEYEYSTRGNPELDVNDIVYQENEFRDNMKVTIYRATLNFNQSFSGKITARRVEG